MMKELLKIIGVAGLLGVSKFCEWLAVQIDAELVFEEEPLPHPQPFTSETERFVQEHQHRPNRIAPVLHSPLAGSLHERMMRARGEL